MKVPVPVPVLIGHGGREAMKVLVTGGSGQVGSRLVRQLLERSHEVRVTAWAKDPALERLAGLELETLEGDLTDPPFVRRAVQGVDAVVHTANLVGPYFENNVQTTLEVARACGEQADALDRFVYVSSSGVFPNDSHVLACAYHPVDEQHPRRATNEYNLSKLIGEQITELTARRTGLRTVVVRPSHVLSGDRVLGQFTVARVVGVLKSGQQNPGSERTGRTGRSCGPRWRPAPRAPTSPASPATSTGAPGTTSPTTPGTWPTPWSAPWSGRRPWGRPSTWGPPCPSPSPRGAPCWPS